MELFLLLIKAPLESIMIEDAQPERPGEIILLGFWWAVSLLHGENAPYWARQHYSESFVQVWQTAQKQETTSIKVCTQAAFSLLRVVKVMYNIHPLLPMEKHGFSSGAQISQNSKWHLCPYEPYEIWYLNAQAVPLISFQLLKKQTK